MAHPSQKPAPPSELFTVDPIATATENPFIPGFLWRFLYNRSGWVLGGVWVGTVIVAIVAMAGLFSPNHQTLNTPAPVTSTDTAAESGQSDSSVAGWAIAVVLASCGVGSVILSQVLNTTPVAERAKRRQERELRVKRSKARRRRSRAERKKQDRRQRLRTASGLKRLSAYHETDYPLITGGDVEPLNDEMLAAFGLDPAAFAPELTPEFEAEFVPEFEPGFEPDVAPEFELNDLAPAIAPVVETPTPNQLPAARSNQSPPARAVKPAIDPALNAWEFSAGIMGAEPTETTVTRPSSGARRSPAARAQPRAKSANAKRKRGLNPFRRKSAAPQPPRRSPAPPAAPLPPSPPTVDVTDVTVMPESATHPLDWDEPSLAHALDMRSQLPLDEVLPPTQRAS